ncbi:MAG: hypothetical protein ABH954_00445 [Candidatus Omnitrophota bacterium]
MAKFSKRSLSRSLFRVVLIIILLILIPPLLINLLFNSHRQDIEKTLSNYLNQELSIKSIYYLPPNKIILDNSTAFVKTVSKGNQQLFIEKTKLTFSLKDLIAKKKFKVKEISLDRLSLDYIEYLFSPQEIIDSIKEFIKPLDKNQVYRLVLKDALFAFPPHAGAAGYMAVDAILDIQPAKFISFKGSVNLTGSALRDDPREERLDYNFRGSFKRGGINIDIIEFQKGNSYLKLWGVLDEDLLRLNGNFLSGKPAETRRKKNLLFKISNKLEDKFKEFFLALNKTPLPEFIGPSSSGLSIFNLGCLVQFVPSGLQIKNLNFSFGKIPFSLKGDIFIFDKGKIKLNFSSFPNQPKEKRSENPNRLDLKLSGNLEDAKFNGQLDLEFLRKTKTKQFPQKIEATFRNLGLNFVAYQWLKAYLDEAKLTCAIDNNIYDISFRDFNCLLNTAQKKIKFNALVYDGQLDGEAKIDVSRQPFKSSMRFDIKDVNANQLSSVSSYFSKVHGGLNAKVNYENYPTSALSGNLSILGGYLDNLRFFGWLADFFSMPELKKVSFNEICADFLVDNEISALEGIMLDSENLTLEGNFNIDEDDFVSGKLSLVLSEELLNTSPKFKRLLRLIGKDLSTVSFDFQMSGLYQNMNFKWLESEFKSRLKKLLPAGMERKLEAEIESAIESVSSSK